MGAECAGGHRRALYDDSTLHYAVTGHDVPTSLAWWFITRQPLSGNAGRWTRHGPDGTPQT